MLNDIIAPMPMQVTTMPHTDNHPAVEERHDACVPSLPSVERARPKHRHGRASRNQPALLLRRKRFFFSLRPGQPEPPRPRCSAPYDEVAPRARGSGVTAMRHHAKRRLRARHRRAILPRSAGVRLHWATASPARAAPWSSSTAITRRPATCGCPLVPSLAQRHTVIVPDLRGAGGIRQAGVRLRQEDARGQDHPRADRLAGIRSRQRCRSRHRLDGRLRVRRAVPAGAPSASC